MDLDVDFWRPAADAETTRLLLKNKTMLGLQLRALGGDGEAAGAVAVARGLDALGAGLRAIGEGFARGSA